MTDVGVAPLREPTGPRGTVAALGDAVTERAATPSTTSDRAKRTGSSLSGPKPRGQSRSGGEARARAKIRVGTRGLGSRITTTGVRRRERRSEVGRDGSFTEVALQDRRDRCVRASRWLRPVEVDATHRRRNHPKPDGLPSAGSSGHLGARKPEFTRDGREVMHRPCVTGERGRAESQETGVRGDRWRRGGSNAEASC